LDFSTLSFPFASCPDRIASIKARQETLANLPTIALISNLGMATTTTTTTATRTGDILIRLHR
jgi:hypothetical protein